MYEDRSFRCDGTVMGHLLPKLSLRCGHRHQNLGKNLGVVDGYLEKREERKKKERKKERALPKAAFSNTKKRKKEASFVQI